MLNIFFGKKSDLIFPNNFQVTVNCKLLDLNATCEKTGDKHIRKYKKRQNPTACSIRVSSKGTKTILKIVLLLLIKRLSLWSLCSYQTEERGLWQFFHPPYKGQKKHVF